MSSNTQKSDRQYACQMARKYLCGDISKYNLLDSFPDTSNDKELNVLYNALTNEPKAGGLFGINKEKHKKYILDVYNIIDNLESLASEDTNKSRSIYFFLNTCQNCANDIEIPLLGDFSYGEIILQTSDGKDFLVAVLIDNDTFGHIDQAIVKSGKKNIDSQKILSKLADPFNGKTFTDSYPICPKCCSKLRHYNDDNKTTRHIINYATWNNFEALTVDRKAEKLSELIDKV